MSADEDPGSTSEHRVPGLRAPAEILVDRWGIPHLYAESAEDLYFLQGFDAARNRLFQIDHWRRRMLGELAAVWGPAYVEQDRAARLFLYRGDIEAEWAAYGPTTRMAVTRFVEGINARIDWLAEHPAMLPPEFVRLGYLPARWRPEDVVRPRAHGPAHNFLFEVARSRVFAAGEPEDDRLRQRLERGHRPIVPEGFDARLPADIARDYLLATGAPRLGPPDTDGVEGSNNWALAGSRTTTGRPLLASDPHRLHATPSLRYLTHLSAPGIDVIGAGEPGMPGVALGHNEVAAFGFTIFTIDSEDLYVCELASTPIERVVETLAVQGESDREVVLEFTAHGPVVATDRERGKAYVLRSTWFEPGTAPYLGSLDYQAAKSWADFSAALTNWRLPGENHVYADVHGTIAWQAAGLVPRRTGEVDGLLPLPIRPGEDTWHGFRSLQELPGVVDPASGFVATANACNVPDELPLPAYEWPDHARLDRIVEVLESRERHSLGDMTRLQTDLLSSSARTIVETLRGLDLRAVPTARGPDGESDSRLGAALDLLLGWDCVESIDSAATALYEVWLARHLGPGLVGRLAQPGAADSIPVPDPRVVREAMAKPQRWFGSEPERARDAWVVEALLEAYDEVAGWLGPDPGRWRWGDLHRNVAPHPLGGRWPEFDVGPEPVGGSGSTVAAAAYFPDDFSPGVGSSFRMVVDVGAWDNSVCVVAPGESGDPRSLHYRDLYERWRIGEYVPMLYSRAAIEANLEARLRFLPG